MKKMTPGYLYVLKNKSFQDFVVKIGKTKREPDCRAREIYCGATGVPEPFDVAFACSVADCSEAEKRVHHRFGSYRINDSREFFKIPPLVARQVVLDVCHEVNAEYGSAEPIIAIEWGNRSTKHEPIHDRYEEKYGEVFSIPIDMVKHSPIGTSSLTSHQKNRIKILSTIFSEVYGDSNEGWNESFSRDKNAEHEIRIWEHIAKAFLKVDQVEYLSTEAKEEAYSLLLMRSHTPSASVLREHRIKHFTQESAQKILAGYELPAAPLKVRFHAGSSSPPAKKIIYPTTIVSAIQSIYAPRKMRG